MRDWINRRFEVADERQKLTSQDFTERVKLATHEFKLYVNQLVTEADAKNEKRFAEAEVKNEKRLLEVKESLDKRLNQLEVMIAEKHTSQIRWMFTFFVGLLFTLAGLMFTYLQLMGKP